MGCCKKFWKLIVLFLSLSADTFDFISDWIFYSEQALAEDGLVFGVYEKSVVTASLIFCLIGTVTYIIEIFLNLCEYKSDSKKVQAISEVMTLVTLFTEDLPQIGINVHIALCREEATNTIQIVKASAAMFEVVVKLIFMIVRYCKRKRDGEELRKLRKVSEGLAGFSFFVILVLSGVVFYYTTNFQEKTIKFDSEGLSVEESEKYLQGVSIFTRFNSTKLPSMEDDQWIKLISIKSATMYQNQSTGVTLAVMYTPLPSEYIWVIRNNAPDTASSCFIKNFNQMTMIPPENCSKIFTGNNNAIVLSLRLTHREPNKYQPLGDLHYNLKIHRINCQSVPVSNSIVTLRYFKVKSSVNEVVALTLTGGNTNHYRYFTSPGDLINTKEYWKTGKNKCDSTGREAPKLDTNIGVSCLSL